MKHRQLIMSIVVFGLIIGALVTVDARVHDEVVRLVSGGGGISSLDDRLVSLGGALGGAIRYQSANNTPLFVFAVVGTVLFLFMVRT